MTGVTAHTVTTAFFGKTYGEAVDLLVEARDYLSVFEPDEHGALKPMERLVMCSETLRLTARLTQIMAWLLAQRAVQSGEMSREQALAEPLAGLGICMDGEDSEDEPLPPRLSELLGRSRRLYVRVARLDELARQVV
jgi:regulator of CtrA degradation